MTFPMNRELWLNPFDWAFKDLNMVGIWYFNTYDFPKTIELMKIGQFPVRELVTSVIRIEEIVKEGFEILSSDDVGTEIKIQVSFE